MEILVGFFVGISILAISVAIYDWVSFGTFIGKRRGKKPNINQKGSRGPGKQSHVIKKNSAIGFRVTAFSESLQHKFSMDDSVTLYINSLIDHLAF